MGEDVRRGILPIPFPSVCFSGRGLAETGRYGDSALPFFGTDRDLVASGGDAFVIRGLAFPALHHVAIHIEQFPI